MNGFTLEALKFIEIIICRKFIKEEFLLEKIDKLEKRKIHSQNSYLYDKLIEKIKNDLE